MYAFSDRINHSMFKSERITPLKAVFSADDSELESRVSIPILDTLAIGLIGHYKFDGNAKDSRQSFAGYSLSKNRIQDRHPGLYYQSINKQIKPFDLPSTLQGGSLALSCWIRSPALSVSDQTRKILYDSSRYLLLDRLIFDGGFHFFSSIKLIPPYDPMSL